MKKFYGHRAYVQSAGVRNDLEIDGFAVAVCAELGVELQRHRVRSFDEMQEWGDDLSGFDLIIALSPASQRRALDMTRHFHNIDVEYSAHPRPHRPWRNPRGQAPTPTGRPATRIVSRMIARLRARPPKPPDPATLGKRASLRYQRR